MAAAYPPSRYSIMNYWADNTPRGGVLDDDLPGPLFGRGRRPLGIFLSAPRDLEAGIERVDQFASARPGDESAPHLVHYITEANTRIGVGIAK